MHVNNEKEINTMEMSSVNLENSFSYVYASDKLFSPVNSAPLGHFPSHPVQRNPLQRILPSFTLQNGKVLYKGRLCVLRRNVGDVLLLAQDESPSGIFGLRKTLTRIEKFHWQYESMEVKRYCDGCLTCQKNRDSRSERLGEPTLLNIPTRRWGWIATDFIIHLLKKK